MQIASLTTITLQASLLILLVLGIRRVWGRALRPWVAKCLWGVIALRILIPVQISIDWKWWAFLPKWNLNAEITFGFSLKELAAGIWLAGAVLLILMFWIRNLHFVRKLKKAREVYGKKDGILVYFIDGKIGSCLEGLFLPKIYISRLAEQSFDWCKWIVSHEICHYHARDNWYGFLRNLCLILQWFNPLVWYAARCSVEDCELVCDYKVLRGKNIEEQIMYGKCLTAMAAKKPAGFLQNLVTGNALSNGSLKRRIEQIGRNTFCSPVIERILVIVIVGLTLSCFLGSYNEEYTVMNLARRVPFLKDRIFCYQLEDPTEENMDRVLKNAAKRKRECYIEKCYLVKSDKDSVAVFFPDLESYWSTYYEERAERIFMDTEVMLEVDGYKYVFDLSGEMLMEKHTEDGHSLWLSLADVGIDGSNIENYKVYYLGTHRYDGTAEDIQNGYIRLDNMFSYDDLWDKKQILLLKNPCKLTKK